METALQLLTLALVTGCIYGLIGLSLSSVFVCTGIVNFAQGDFAMVGAMLAYFTLTVVRWGIPVGIIITVVVMALVAITVVKLLINPLLARRAALVPIIIGTMACSIVMGQITLLIAGPVPHLVPYFFGGKVFHFWGIPFQIHYAVVIVVTVILTYGYYLFMHRTLLGIAVRAASSNIDAARLLGIKPSTVTNTGFLLCATLGGLAGFLVAPMVGANPHMGFPLVVKGFMAAILGGIEYPYGAIVGGLIIGTVSTFLNGYGFTQFSEVAVFMLIILVIVFRPSGLFQH